MKQKIKRILSALLVLAIIAVTPIGDFVGIGVTAGAAYTINHTADEAIAYIAGQTAKCQCVVYANKYISYLCGSPISINSTVWLVNNPSAVSGYPFTLIQGAVPQKGDMLLWTNGTYGHIAIYENDYSWYDANYKLDEVVRHHTEYWKTAVSNYWGVLRPNFSGSSGSSELIVPDPVFYSVKSGEYTIRNASVGYMMNVKSGIDNNGNIVFGWEWDGSVDQKFKVNHENNGSYWIYAMCSSNGTDKVVSVDQGGDGKVTSGDSLILYTKGSSNTQLFYFVPIGDNAYVLESFSSDNLVATLSSNSNGAYITMQPYTGSIMQHWFLCDYSGNVVDAAGNIDINSFSTVTIADQTYTGGALTPDVKLTVGDLTLKNGTDYTVTYSNNIHAGTATATIKGIGYYSGTITKTFKINPKPISGLSLGSISNQTYTGAEIKPAITLKNGSATLTSGTHYTVAYSNNTNVGTATVNVTGKGDYTGTRSTTFKIVAKPASGLTVSSIADQTYTGGEIKPSITVKNGSTTLTNGTHYTVAYSNNTNVGTATVMITGKGNFTGTKSVNFKIVAKPASGLTVSSIADQTYTGGEIKPSITVKNGSTTLTNGTHYTVAYSNNTNVGTATVTITGKGNFTGTKSVNFKIVAKPASSLTVSSIADQTYTGGEIKPSITVKNGSTTLTNGTHYTVTYSNNKNVGTATVTITGKGNFTGTKTVNFKIVPRSISGLTLDAIADQTYTGGELTPAVTIKNGSVPLTIGTHYTAAYSNNINAGTATVTLTGKGNYTGTKTATFRILPKSVSGLNISAIADQAYTGSGICPSVTVSDGALTLKSGTDYTVTYANNINVGTASAVVTGKGNYNGTKTIYFDIVDIVPKALAARAGNGEVTITWDDVDGASKYAVYIYKDGKYICLDSAVTDTSYTATELDNGVKVGFKVKSCFNGKWSAASDIVYATPKAPAPTNIKATAGDTKATVTWDKVDGATKYAVYKYIDGKYTCLTTAVTGTSYTVTGLENGTKYGFKVKAYVDQWSGASSMAYATPAVPNIVPQSVKAKAGNGQATITWSAVSGATKYAVYIYKDGKYTCLNSNIKTTSYTVTDLENGVKVGFKVKAYAGKWSGASAMAYATPTDGNIIPQNVKATGGDTTATITWNAVAGAERYAVYIYKDGKYTCINSKIKSNSYTVTDLENGVKVGFKVKAYINGAWSGASAIAWATPAE